MRCPTCRAKGYKVIYLALPMKLCSDDRCSTCWGFWSWVPAMWFNGMFMTYEGSYLVALCHWLFGDLSKS